MSEIWFLKCLVLNGFIINIKVKSFKIPNGLFKLLKSLGWAAKCYRGRKGGNAKHFRIGGLVTTINVQLTIINLLI